MNITTIPIPTSADEAVQNGLRVLEEYAGITIDRLRAKVFPQGFVDYGFDMGSCSSCVLGRSFGDYAIGLDALGWNKVDTDTPLIDQPQVRCGFETTADQWGYAELSEAWERVLLPEEFANEFNEET